MNRDSSKGSGMPLDGAPPSDAWLFAQAILRKPISRIVSPQAKALAERRELERLAQFSTSHAKALRSLQTAEAGARRDRQLLEWAAQISTQAEDKLRALQRKEAEERDAWGGAEQFVATLLEGNWDPSKHPRGAFPQNRGWWSPRGGSGSARTAEIPSTPVQTASFQAGQPPARLATFSGAQSAT